MLSPRTKSALILIAASALSMSASAHTGVEAHSHSGFISGFVHPLFGLDHLAAMVAVGLWSALAARSAGRDLLWGPVGFAAMLLVGAVLGLQGVALPAVEPMIAASLLVMGLLVATRAKLPLAVTAGVVGVFAVFHGIAHGTELAGGGNGFAPLLGMLVATIALHLAGVGLGLALRSHSVWWPRVVGGLTALLGGAFLLHLV